MPKIVNQCIKPVHNEETINEAMMTRKISLRSYEYFDCKNCNEENPDVLKANNRVINTSQSSIIISHSE